MTRGQYFARFTGLYGYTESKVLAEIPADVDPEMARAMQTFPQWTQEEIQGYFDQGWTVESLQDWVNNQ